MKQINIKDIEFPDISEQDLQKLDNLKIDDLLTEEQNKELIESLKQRLRESKNPDRWITLEEMIHCFNERCAARKV